MNDRPREQSLRVRVDGAALLDARRTVEGPVSLLFEADREPSGPFGEVGRLRLIEIVGKPSGADIVIDRSDAVLLPGLVNAHTHLDLTAIGPQPHDPAAGFVSWIGLVIRERPVEADAIRAAVRLGIRKSLAGGVVAVGDIAGVAGGDASLIPGEELARSSLSGVSFIEWLSAVAPRSEDAVRKMLESPRDFGGGVRFGHSPHAPYTVRPADYRFPASAPWCTHLAETLEEREFVAEAAGPFRAMLDRIACFDEDFASSVGKGEHPIEALTHAMGRGMDIGLPLLVHLNDCPPEHLDRLSGASVAYCPRASAYFGAPERIGPHRYREMLDRGINVCLGTDSIVDLDTPDRISPLDDARLLHQRDGVSADTLMAMLTLHGARALGLEESGFVFEPGGDLAGVVAVQRGDGESVSEAVFGSERAPKLLLVRSPSCETGINDPGKDET
ncbi:MAG: amidohydrolase family protein [Planctomycetota bacterium]